MRITLLAVAVGLACTWGPGAEADNHPADATEDGGAVHVTQMLREPRFENGVRPPSNGANALGMGADALDRWRESLPAIADASWQFVTVAESTRFNDNPDTPAVTGERTVYASVDGSKRFETDRETGVCRFLFDTEKEWRNGCNLSLPVDGEAPRYLAGHAWNWPHFLLEQAIIDPNAEDGKLRLTAYQNLELRFDAELLHSAKGEPAQCPPGTWGAQRIPDHCLFYTALVMTREGDRPAGDPNAVNPERIYALYPLFYSNGGERYDEACVPWLGDDPAHAAVYFTPNHVCLEQRRRFEVPIDAIGLAREAVAAINERHDAGLSADDYVIGSILIGWEIWGAYQTDIQLSGLSFEGRRDETQAVAPPAPAD